MAQNISDMEADINDILRRVKCPSSIFFFQQFVLFDKTMLAFVMNIFNKFINCPTTGVRYMNGVAGRI